MITLSPGSTLVLADLAEPSTNDFRLVVVEAKPQPRSVETEVGLAHPIEPDETSRAFELVWWNYVSYVVRNESYFKPEENEELGRQLVGTREHTAFLRYVQDTTFATSDYPGPLTHWFVYTEWQCIDVVSNTPPDIREMTAAEVETIMQARLFEGAGGVFQRPS